jgi:hypothetical protein
LVEYAKKIVAKNDKIVTNDNVQTTLVEKCVPGTKSDTTTKDEDTVNTPAAGQ